MKSAIVLVASILLLSGCGYAGKFCYVPYFPRYDNAGTAPSLIEWGENA